ncbi:MAG: class I SAM-dependent methyltransferase [Algicola sp.]|nr:class I SAM-dependent methyltransferase [Algicola sp.]
MEQIYDEHLWGGTDFDFYSGEGSHDPKIVNPYLEAVSSFLESHNKSLVVCDLGCGDFNIGKQLLKYSKCYIGIDIVEKLIERNKTRYQEGHLQFDCMDIVKDELPKADCAILRQVLQHLSNKEIETLSKKLSIYKYLILTEHIPIGHFIPNSDMITGQGNRLKYKSGVDLLQAPFHLKIKSQQVLCTSKISEKEGQIVSILYEL